MLSPGDEVVPFERPFFDNNFALAAGSILGANRFDLNAQLACGFAQACSFVHVTAAPGRLQDDEVLFAHRVPII
jgi:hypothetical protein